ncbi:MAG: carbohydrate-binding family 9-like protein [Victivallaceae bacterium]|nr:carbohydrate-binding family 9-like protein [Victivallaceae bacterium]
MKKNEWKEAAKTLNFLSPRTARQAQPETCAWLGLDRKNLYLAFRCLLSEENGKNIPGTRKRDGAVYSDESVEIFIRPDQKTPFYYQLAVNSAGVRFDQKCGLNASTGVKTSSDLKWNPDWKVKTTADSKFWTLEAAIPLSELAIVPSGTKVVRMNLCRNIIGKKHDHATWSYLPVLSFHSPQYFNFGIMNFDASGGRALDLSGITGGPGLLWAKAEKNALILPGDHKIALKTGLPEILFKTGNITLKSELFPLAGKDETKRPLYSDTFRLRSSAPLILTVSGLIPGNYQLRLTIKGAGVHLSEKLPVFVRNRNLMPEIKGKVVLDNRNWKNALQADQVEAVPGAGLILKSEFKAPVAAFDPTNDKTITCMTDYNGKLFLGACTSPAATDTGSVFAYNPEMDLWEKVFQVNEQGLTRMKVYNGKLYLPGYDANDGGWDLGNIYIYDGRKWIERRTVPRAVHIYDLVGYKGKIYISAGIFDPAPAGMTIANAFGKRKIKIHGCVLSSDDEGKTWKEEYKDPCNAQNVGLMTVFQDKIILNANGEIVCYDGSAWKPFSLNPKALYVYTYAEKDKNTLLMGTPFGLCCYDGKKLWTVKDLYYIRAIANFNGKWVLCGYLASGYNAYHGPGGTGYPGDYSINFLGIFSPEFLLVNIRESNLTIKAIRKIFVFLKTKDACVSAHVFKGRLYLGTHPEGRVLVFPVAREGSLESLPVKLDKKETYRLWWYAATPPDTEVKFQIRTAETRPGLANEKFVGPDGTVNSYYEKQGESVTLKKPDFFQYKAILITKNPARTPYLKRFILTTKKR